MVLQVTEVVIFEGDSLKKNVKARVNLSDGISTLICMVPDKLFKAMEKKMESPLRQFDVWVFPAAKQQI